RTKLSVTVSHDLLLSNPRAVVAIAARSPDGVPMESARRTQLGEATISQVSRIADGWQKRLVSAPIIRGPCQRSCWAADAAEDSPATGSIPSRRGSICLSYFT